MLDALLGGIPLELVLLYDEVAKKDGLIGRRLPCEPLLKVGGPWFLYSTYRYAAPIQKRQEYIQRLMFPLFCPPLA